MFTEILSPKKSKNASWLRRPQDALHIEILNKRTELVAPSSGLACSGARDQPPPGGNVKRGSPIAQVGPAPGEAILHAFVLSLPNDATLSELIQLRSRLLADNAKSKRRHREGALST